MSHCKRCHRSLGASTAVVEAGDNYPANILRVGDPLCVDCARDRQRARDARAYPGGSVGGVPKFNRANREYVERSNAVSPSLISEDATE